MFDHLQYDAQPCNVPGLQLPRALTNLGAADPVPWFQPGLANQQSLEIFQRLSTTLVVFEPYQPSMCWLGACALVCRPST